jgi:4-hydroxybenzoate polyprenyltransferase
MRGQAGTAPVSGAHCPRAAAVLKLMRPKQWIKNLFVFGPLVFSLHLFHPPSLLRTALCFAAFSLTASGLYAINDVADADQDRLHPVKRRRPVAAGLVSPAAAVTLGILLLLAGMGSGALLGRGVVAVLAGYVGLNLFYSFRGKHLPIVDIMTIAVDFVLRVLAGALAIGVAASAWLIVATFFLATLIAIAKRYNEMKVLEGDPAAHRQVLDFYTPTLLSQLLSISAGATIVFYALYTLDEKVVATFGTADLIYTLPFVVYGVFHYLYLVYRREEGGDPTELVARDLPMLVDLALWALAVVLIIY